MKSTPLLLAVQVFIKRLQTERVQCFSPCQAKSQIPTAFVPLPASSDLKEVCRNAAFVLYTAEKKRA